jgi:hypothetical protein
MPLREIPREDWETFFDRFSGQHQGWLVTIEASGSDRVADVETRELPFEGITRTLTGSDDVVSIIVRKDLRGHALHSVKAPSHIRLEQTETGAHKALQIESANGATTVIRFRSVVLPEMVDGIAR